MRKAIFYNNAASSLVTSVRVTYENAFHNNYLKKKTVPSSGTCRNRHNVRYTQN